MTLYDAMLAAADPSQVEGLSRFFKTGPGQYGEGDKFLGIKVPVTRAIVKEYWRTALPENPQQGRPNKCRTSLPENPQKAGFPELDRCISSEYHEVRLAALLALVEFFAHAKKRPGQDEGLSLRERCIDFYLAHTDRINNWDLVDLSCYPLLGEWLLDKDRSLLYRLARNGKTLWEQRIGIVSTMTFIRHGQLRDTFAIADILLHHPHDLIHKAVGWLLREAGKRDEAALEAWLQETPDQAGGDERLRKTPDQVGGDDGVRKTPDQAGSDDGVRKTPDQVGGDERLREPPDQVGGDDGLQETPDQAGGDGRPGTREAVMPGADRASLPRYRQMPRTMLRYAIERFPETRRQAYLHGEI